MNGSCQWIIIIHRWFSNNHFPRLRREKGLKLNVYKFLVLKIQYFSSFLVFSEKNREISGNEKVLANSSFFVSSGFIHNMAHVAHWPIRARRFCRPWSTFLFGKKLNLIFNLFNFWANNTFFEKINREFFTKKFLREKNGGSWDLIWRSRNGHDFYQWPDLRSNAQQVGISAIAFDQSYRRKSFKNRFDKFWQSFREKK